MGFFFLPEDFYYGYQGSSVGASCRPALRVMALSIQLSDIFITNRQGDATGMADFFNHAITRLFPLLFIGFNVSCVRQWVNRE